VDKLESGVNTINIKGLNEGLYILKYTNHLGEIITKRFTKI